jgi:hypothetical protein
MRYTNSDDKGTTFVLLTIGNSATRGMKSIAFSGKAGVDVVLVKPCLCWDVVLGFQF